MKRASIVITILVFGVACAPPDSAGLKAQHEKVIGYCLSEVERLTGKPLSSKADRAYLQDDRTGYVVYFTHGTIGTFGERSLDYSVVMSCAALKEPRLKLVYLGKPQEDPLVQEPEEDQFDSPEGSIEVLFKRESGRFEYCCSQPFDEKNIEKNNPDFPWEEVRGD